MADIKIIEIRYRCQHPSCQIKSCREGVIEIDETLFEQLRGAYPDEPSLFKSPRGLCRMGLPQPLKILNIGRGDATGEGGATEGIAEVEEKGGIDPVEILKGEHLVVLRNLDRIEEQIRRRDIDGLWITSAEVEDEITLHSIEKEELVLFPLLEKVYPLGAGEVAIMKEDHRELMALLHSFRTGLREGDILDSVAHSMIANLRSHIRKEDEEFFPSISSHIDREERKRLLDGMAKAEKSHIPIEAGDRCAETHHEDEAASLERERFKEALTAAKKASRDDGCCH